MENEAEIEKALNWLDSNEKYTPQRFDGYDGKVYRILAAEVRRLREKVKELSTVDLNESGVEALFPPLKSEDELRLWKRFAKVRKIALVNMLKRAEQAEAQLAEAKAENANLRQTKAAMHDSLMAEIESHHEESEQICGYKKLIDAQAEIERLKSEYGKVSVDIQSLCDTELKCRKLEVMCAEKDEALKWIENNMPMGVDICIEAKDIANKALYTDGSAILKQLEAAERLYEILIQGTIPEYLSDHWKNIVERMKAYEQSREKTK